MPVLVMNMITLLKKTNDTYWGLLNYPHYSYREKIEKELANKYDIYFVDINSAFERLKAPDNYKHEDYFTEDAHCTAKGYKVIAEKIYKILLYEVGLSGSR